VAHQHSSDWKRQEDRIPGDTRIWVGPSNAILTPMRDASCRGSPLSEHRWDLAPAIHASEADLAAGHEAE